MRTLLKAMLRRALPVQRVRYAAFRALISNERSYLYSSGWMASMERGYPCKEDGSELPWMNFSVATFLEYRLQNDLLLFEYGSGSSTLFYARFVKAVTSVEHDKMWYAEMKKKKLRNVELYAGRERL